ncbi:MAG: VanW family protein [Thermoleophilia bacterium]|nr:VanW family protein [Thermoleophilia bacterium]
MFLIVVFILVDSALYYNKIHNGITIAGQEVQGLTKDEARAAVNQKVEKALRSPITLRSGDKSWQILPKSLGTKIDVESAVSQAFAYTRESNIIVDLMRRFKLYFSGTDVPLPGTVDSKLIDRLIEDVAQEIDVPPVNAGLAIEGKKIKVIEGQKGRVVDRAALKTQLTEILLSLHSTDIEIPMMLKEPEVQAEDTETAKQQAQIMISAPIRLVGDSGSWTLGPEEIAAYMDFGSEKKDGIATLVPYLSAEKMAPFLDMVAENVRKEPVNASFDSDGNKAWVVPGAPGEELDREKTAQALTAAALKESGRVARVVVRPVEPDLTTEEAEAMGIKDKLAGFTTEWVGTPNRQVNVRITTKYASDVILAPGEIYDFDKQIGPRTEARGYKLAPGIVGPGRLEDVFGGGICQVATTLFNAVFFAGLEIVERHNHSLYIEHYPKGRDATVTAGGPNLRFRNDTDHYIWIRGTSDGIRTTFNIYGTSDGRKVTYTTSEFYNIVPQTEVTITNPSLSVGTTVVKIPGQDGKQITVTRTITWPDGRKKVEKFVSTYPMIPRQIEVGTGTTTTTTTAPPSTTTTRSSTTTSATVEF